MAAPVAGAAAESTTRGYRPELDALRAVAAVLVFVHHVPLLRGAGHAEGGWLPGGGWVGVTVFFTLSGYLITSIMLRDERPSIGAFYLRRARRLLPALVGVLVVVAVVAWALDDVATMDALPWAALYGGNLHDMGWLAHTWSLAVEEHFYIVWPLVFVLARRRLLEVTCGLVVVSVLCRVAMVAAGWAWWDVVTSDFAQASGPLVGCALAVLLHRGVTIRVPAWVGIAGIVVCLFGTPLVGATVRLLVGYSILPLFTAALIAAWTTRPPSTPRWLAGFGKISYGFYLWHYPLLIWLDRAWHLPTVAHAAAAFVATLWVSHLSWVFLESRWRHTPTRYAQKAEVSASRVIVEPVF